MPNPFMRLGTPNTAEHKAALTTPGEIVEGAPDVPEEILPYRGLASRSGVPPNDEYEEFPGYAGTHGAEFEPEPPADHVIPVYVVGSISDARSRRLGRAFQVPVLIGADRPQLVLGQNDDRISATLRFITASATDQVFFGGSATEADPLQGLRFTGQIAPYEFKNDAQTALFVNAPAIGGGTAAGATILVSVWEVVASRL